MYYEYIGYTADRRVVKGKIDAAGEKEAGDRLASNGYQILSLKASGGAAITGMPALFERRAKPEEIIMFSRQLALLLESGVGIVQSLDLLKVQTTNKAFAGMLDTIISDLRAGSPLSVALDKQPRAFNKMYCKMIAVGEQTGQLESVLRNLASYAEQSTAAMRKIRQAMTYPIIVIILAICVGFLAVTFILPPIMDMFKSLGGKLPLITQILISFVGFMGNYGIFVMLAVVALCILVYMYTRTPDGTLQKDRFLLYMPVLGRLNLINTLARICRSITILFRSGLPLPEILKLTAESSGNKVVFNALMEVEQDIIKGEGLASAMRRHPEFLPLMVEMTRVGEETGNLDNTLTIVADSFEIEATDKLQTILGMIEPAMTIIIGLGVAFLALSIFIPIYSSMSLIGK
ncbi:MAG: type II secretion system F family protein [Dehalococcoidia bacterium]|nr:type II secretion system F family protein [Dehalococcoidia bacterium]